MNTNKIFLLGDMISEVNNGRKIKVNSGLMRIQALQVLSYSVVDGEKFKVNVGGLFGQTRRVTGRENMPPMFLSFGGFTASPTLGYGYGMGIGGMPGPHVGMKFSTGGINVIDYDTGQFYVAVMGRK